MLMLLLVPKSIVDSRSYTKQHFCISAFIISRSAVAVKQKEGAMHPLFALFQGLGIEFLAGEVELVGLVEKRVDTLLIGEAPGGAEEAQQAARSSLFLPWPTV